jgi:hypothetical protein
VCQPCDPSGRKSPPLFESGNDCHGQGTRRMINRSDEFESRRYFPTFVELMKASRQFYVAFRQHISEKITNCSSRHYAIIF